MGKTRGARYALRRPIVGIGSEWPIFRIDESGAFDTIGTLQALEGDRYYVTAGPPRARGASRGEWDFAARDFVVDLRQRSLQTTNCAGRIV